MISRSRQSRNGTLPRHIFNGTTPKANGAHQPAKKRDTGDHHGPVQIRQHGLFKHPQEVRLREKVRWQTRDADELSEGKDFLAWLADNHFTFLGYRCHDLVTINGADALKIVADSSLGILRESRSKDVATSFAALPPEVKAYARRPELLVVTKSTSRSTVHRPGYLDYIAVKRFNAGGEVVGEHRFLGLFTSTAYSANPGDIPLLRRKAANVWLAVSRLPVSTSTSPASVRTALVLPNR